MTRAQHPSLGQDVLLRESLLPVLMQALCILLHDVDDVELVLYRVLILEIASGCTHPLY